jgi:Protein of unknown function (DUF1570)
MMIRGLGLGLALIVGAVACGAAVPPLPSKGGPAWREVSSEHFTLWTDAPARRGHELVRELEQRRQVIIGAMNRAPQRARIFVIALRNARELAAFLPSEVLGQAWPASNPLLQPAIALGADSPDEEQEEVINHEIAHVVSYSIIKRQSKWLAEGIAGYFERAKLDPGTRKVVIGLPRREHVVLLRQSGALSASLLLGCASKECSKTAQFYATSWLLFSYLLNKHTDQFSRYLARLNEWPSEQHLQAWQEVFPELPPDELDRVLRRMIASLDLILPEVSVAAKTYPTTERPLGDADALAARSLLWAMNKRPDVALATVKAALAIDPAHLIAWMASDALGSSPSAEQARAVAAAHADDWRAWYLVVKALDSGAEQSHALERLCTLDSEHCKADLTP